MTRKAIVSQLRPHQKYEHLIAATKGLPALPTAVAHPCDETSLQGALEAAQAGMIAPILVGADERIRTVAQSAGLEIEGIKINDVRELLASSNPRAKLALDYFACRIALHAKMLAAAMGGIDGFVFTAGIGENTPSIRDAVMRRLSWLGAEIASEPNAKGETRISREGSRVACLVIPTDEELMIARHTLRVLRKQTAAPLREKQA